MIREHFAITFNRKGFVITIKADIYDLTGAAEYWYPNHLLMRIKDDTKEDMIFMDGDLEIRGLGSFTRGC